MNYKNKYLKYKLKYMNKTGGTKEENNNFLLHGTNLFYIQDIKKDGLNGKYNEEIYNIILKYWGIIKNKTTVTPYIDYFIDRQKIIRVKKHYISLSFTGKLNVAEEYSIGNRKFGEGPKYFLNNFKEYINKYKNEITEEMKNDFDLLYNASRNPGIILAINKNDFTKIQSLDIEELDNWEHTLDFPIPADKLYIRRNKNDYILLLSPEGEEYINELKCNFIDFIEEEKIRLEQYKLKEEEKVRSLDDWKITIPYNNPNTTLYKYQIENGITISAQYDIFSTQYFSIKIIKDNDIDIHIKINIINTNFITEIIKNKGLDIFLSNPEFKYKLQLVLNGIMETNPEFIIIKKLLTIKKELLEKIIEIFPL
jgi:hypothetical protein